MLAPELSPAGKLHKLGHLTSILEQVRSGPRRTATFWPRASEAAVPWAGSAPSWPPLPTGRRQHLGSLGAMEARLREQGGQGMLGGLSVSPSAAAAPPCRLCYGLAPCSLAAQGSKFTPNSPARTSKGKASSQVCSPSVLQSRDRCPQGTWCPTLCPQGIRAQPSTPQHPPGTPRAPPPRIQTSTLCQLPHLQQLQLQLQQLSGCETSELKPLWLRQACREAGPHKNPTASVPRCPSLKEGPSRVQGPARRGAYHDAGEEADPLPAVGVRHHVAIPDGEEGDGDEPHGPQEVAGYVLLVVVPVRETRVSV